MAPALSWMWYSIKTPTFSTKWAIRNLYRAVKFNKQFVLSEGRRLGIARKVSHV